jgi:drug/metabolite transporter (DMT)-like permease
VLGRLDRDVQNRFGGCLADIVAGPAIGCLFLREEMSLLQLVGALLTVAAVTMISLGDASMHGPRMEQI